KMLASVLYSARDNSSKRRSPLRIPLRSSRTCSRCCSSTGAGQTDQRNGIGRIIHCMGFTGALSLFTSCVGDSRFLYPFFFLYLLASQPLLPVAFGDAEVKRRLRCRPGQSKDLRTA